MNLIVMNHLFELQDIRDKETVMIEQSEREQKRGIEKIIRNCVTCDEGEQKVSLF